MKKLQPIPTGEQAILWTTIRDDGIASLIFSVKENGEPGGPRYNLKQYLDFSGVTEKELLELASKPLRIDIQATWRAAKDRMDADVWQDKKWSVRAMLDRTRQKADPVTKATKNAAKMTAAERKVHLANLEALVKADEEASK